VAGRIFDLAGAILVELVSIARVIAAPAETARATIDASST
jgi:hypothetical protein